MCITNLAPRIRNFRKPARAAVVQLYRGSKINGASSWPPSRPLANLPRELHVRQSNVRRRLVCGHSDEKLRRWLNSKWLGMRTKYTNNLGLSHHERNTSWPGNICPCWLLRPLPCIKHTWPTSDVSFVWRAFRAEIATITVLHSALKSPQSPCYTQHLRNTGCPHNKRDAGVHTRGLDPKITTNTNNQEHCCWGIRTSWCSALNPSIYNVA